jgi:MFS transporter, DHA2 family, multidrug resistance protein
MSDRSDVTKLPAAPTNRRHVERTGSSGYASQPGMAGTGRPPSQGAELLHTAREAFTASLHVTGVAAAVIFAGLAALTWTMRPAARTSPAALPDYEATRS